jgi:ABC-type transporter Mla subunit MlaD
MAGPLNGASGLLKVVPALFKRLDDLVTSVRDVADVTRGMAQEVHELRGDLVDGLAGLREDTQALRAEVATMSQGVESLDARVAKLDTSLDNVDALVNRFTRRGRASRREQDSSTAA